jgi:hypothetical protein
MSIKDLNSPKDSHLFSSLTLVSFLKTVADVGSGLSEGGDLRRLRLLAIGAYERGRVEFMASENGFP